MQKYVLQSLAFLSISLASGYLFWTNGLSFLVGAIFGASLQYVISYLFNSVLNYLASIKAAQIQTEQIKEFTQQGLEVECPCSKKVKDFVPIRLNTANKYKCKECQKLISVYVTPSTALTTEPIPDTDITNPSILNVNANP